MQITIFGRTDKRPCIYTLMKLLAPLGDVAVVTDDRRFRRLTEDGSYTGYCQNIAIYVTDATADEMWGEIGQEPGDFEYIILDGNYNEDTDLILYLQGAGTEELDEYLFDTFEDMVIIHMDKAAGKKEKGEKQIVVPYSKAILSNMEATEYFKQPRVISQQMLNVLTTVLAKHLDMKPKELLKIGGKK